MDSPSEASPSTPKHLFGGDAAVLDLHVDFSADRFGDSGRMEECQVVVDHAELPSDATIEKLWLNLDRKVDIELPWEKGVWKQIFDSSLKPASSDGPHFLRPVFAAYPTATVADVEMPSKKLRMSSFANHWQQVVTNVDEVSWTESQEAKLDTAMKRWYDIVLRFPLGIGIKDQMSLLADVPDQLRVLRDVFATKAPLTLIKRANSLQRYINFLDGQGMLFPGDEDALYRHFCSERESGSPSSRLQSVVEALRFTEHVLGVSQLSAELLSKRVLGASKFQSSGPRRQASPFTVKELRILHNVLVSEDEELWDRMMAGATLCAVYSRSRWSDLQHSEAMFSDPHHWDPCFIEFTVKEHKTKRANAWVEGFLPAVAVAHGVTSDNWGRAWLVVRDCTGGEISAGFPVMPAPGGDHQPTKRPITSDEMGKWVRMLLERHGADLTGRKITSHSCKSTMLSYMAKFGCDITTREILGGHVSHLKSVLTYIRDGLAGPMRELEKVLLSIRQNKFCPDASRSGRFNEVCKVEDCEVAGQVALDGVVDVGAVADRSKETLAVDSDSSTDGDSDTDSSSDEEASNVGRAARLVRCPTAPAGTTLIQHEKSKMLHLLADGYQKIFMCGRQKGNAHKPPVQVRWDSPCCSLCWKAARTKLDSRLVQP